MCIRDRPLCDVVLENNLLEEENHYIVIEMSNFQLLDIDTFKPNVSTIINLTPDHLDYMASLDEYYASKTNIYKNTKKNDCFVVNLDNQVLDKYLKQYHIVAYQHYQLNEHFDIVLLRSYQLM